MADVVIITASAMSPENECVVPWKDKMDTVIKQRRRRLCIAILTLIILYHLVTIPPLFIYTPEKIDEQPALTFLYTRINGEHIQSINLFIDNSFLLSVLKHSEIARSIMLLLGCSVFLYIPMIFYRRNIIKFYMPRMKTVKNITIQGKLLILAVIIFMILSIFINFLFSGQETSSVFPPFNIRYIVFWIRYIFIVCFFGPYTEELFFRGVFLDEIKECYKLSTRSVIFYQAVVFYGLHVIFSGNFAIQPFLIGIITGIFCFYTNSLLYGFIFHVCNNIIVAMLLTGIINTTGLRISNPVILLSFLFIGLTFLCLYLFINQIKKSLNLPSGYIQGLK
jgi:membrane protease YdiL (CAAX protease family)